MCSMRVKVTPIFDLLGSELDVVHLTSRNMAAIRAGLTETASQLKLHVKESTVKANGRAERDLNRVTRRSRAPQPLQWFLPPSLS